MTCIAQGLAKNASLIKLNVSENLFTVNSISQLTTVLMKRAQEDKDDSKSCQLRELDLSHCELDKKSIDALSTLLRSTYKLRILNLRDNMIHDEEGQSLFTSMLTNSYLTKLNMELNPIKHSLFREFETITKQNALKVHD
jgi:hypothetical protein